MTPTLDATVGGPDANSYGTIEEAWAWFDTLPAKLTIGWPTRAAATATIGAGANGVVSIAVEAAGEAGNDYSVEVVSGAPSLNVAMEADLVGDVLTVTLGTDGTGALAPAKNTALLVAAAIDALDEFSATASGTGATVMPVTAEKDFTGGDDKAATLIPMLISGTRLLDQLTCFVGAVANADQALAWPRVGMVDRYDRPIAANAIPDDIKEASFELGRQLSVKNLTADSQAAAEGLKRLKAGPVELEFRDGLEFGALTILPAAVRNMLASQWLCPDTEAAAVLLFDAL